MLPSKFTGFEKEVTCFLDSLCAFKYDFFRQNQLYNNIYCEMSKLKLIQQDPQLIKPFALNLTHYFATLELNVTEFRDQNPKLQANFGDPNLYLT